MTPTPIADVIDTCVIGHVTRDIVLGPDGQIRSQTGGAAYYAATALARLGLGVHLITRLAPADQDLLTELRDLGIRVTVKASAKTTVFEIGADGSAKPVSIASAFEPGDLDGVSARAVVMDPLTSHDRFAAFLEAAAKTAPVVALDLQGFVRKFLIPGVPQEKVAAALPGLRHITIAKATLVEASAITGQSTPVAAARALAEMGPREVIVSFGIEGSLLLRDGKIHAIPAVQPSQRMSITGAGDSYLAGYVAARLEGTEPKEAAQFGAALASLKIARSGAFDGSKADVAALLARQGG
ncbi:MAG: PfkB family carbohydrate kinase [Alphaproteobacteria bacterium]